MANEKNLIPNSERTPSELREICSKGGKASGVARRRKRSLREAADLLLSLPVKDPDALDRILGAGVPVEDADYQMAVVVGMTIGAMNGDSKSARVLMEMLGNTKSDEAESGALDKLDEVLAEIGGVV